MMIQTLKLKVVKPIDLDWKDFAQHLRQADYNVWQLKNKTVTMMHALMTEELEYNKQHPKDKMNAQKRLEKYGKKGHQSIIKARIFDEFSQDGIYKDLLNGCLKEAIDKYKENLKDVLKGRRTIPTFKRNQPMYLPGRSIKIEDKETVNIPLFDLNGRKQHGFKKGNVRVKVRSRHNHALPTFNKILEEKAQVKDSHIQVKGKDVYILLSVQLDEVEQHAISKDKVLGIDLGISKAVVMQVDDTPKHEFIQGGEIDAFRHRIEKQRVSKRNQLKYCSPNRHGHGRKKLLKSLDNISNKIENFKETINHRYSRYIVDYAIKNGCGTIQMEDLTSINHNDTFLKTWSYFDLQTKIQYKANKAGIEVRLIQPQYTSLRCHHCGVIDKDNRPTQSCFKCQTCGRKTNADLNAARNIALSDIENIIQNQLRSQEKVSAMKKG